MTPSIFELTDINSPFDNWMEKREQEVERQREQRQAFDENRRLLASLPASIPGDPLQDDASTALCKLTITSTITGYTWQRVYTNGLGNTIQKLVPTYKALLQTASRYSPYKAQSTITSFDVTRDGWYAYEKTSKGYHMINTAFEPATGKTLFVGAHRYYEHSGEYSLKFHQSGSEEMFAQPYPHATSIGRGKKDVAKGVMVHVGGIYFNSYEEYNRYQLGGSLGCFGVIVGDNKISKSDRFSDTVYVDLMKNGTSSNAGFRKVVNHWKNCIKDHKFTSNEITGLLIEMQPRTLVSRSKIGATANGYYNDYWATSADADVKIGRYSNFVTR